MINILLGIFYYNKSILLEKELMKIGVYLLELGYYFLFIFLSLGLEDFNLSKLFFFVVIV